MIRRGLALAGLILLALGSIAGAQPTPAPTPAVPRLRVSVLDVGQGDAILIRTPEGKSALIDAGPSTAVVTALRNRGITALDLAAVTHHHADHYGGMAAVVREFHPRAFLATDSSHSTPSYLHVLQAVRDTQPPARTIFPSPDEPRRVELGNVALTILPQPPENRVEENDNSIGIRVQYGRSAMLVTGDSEVSERSAWERTCPELLAGCQILKLAHHGSRNGTDSRWLELVHPDLAVASLGTGNDYGHPHAQTLALLAERGVPLLRTDLGGSIELESDGRFWYVAGRVAEARGPPAHHQEHQARAATVEAKPKGKGVAGRIDLNRASLAELETLPGIGPALARRIVEARPFASVEDLERVKGIGPAKMGSVRGLVGVGTIQ